METFTPRSRTRGKTKPPCADIHGTSEHSDDSIPSVILPLSRRCRNAEAIRQRRLIGETLGLDKENYQILNLYIFFTVIIQIVTACGMISVGIVFIILNYRHGLLGDLQVNLSLYLFEASGMLFLIGSYMCSLNHNFYPIPVVKHLKTAALVISFNMICLTAVISWGLKTAFELKDKTFKQFNDLFTDFYRSAEAHSFLDDVQIKFECCGIKDKDDWKSLSMELPPSCCSKFSTDGSCSEWKDKGCYDIYYAKIYSFVHYVIGFGSVALGIAIIALIPTLAAACYAKKNRKLVSSLDRRDELLSSLNNNRERSQEMTRDVSPLQSDLIDNVNSDESSDSDYIENSVPTHSTAKEPM